MEHRLIARLAIILLSLALLGAMSPNNSLPAPMALRVERETTPFEVHVANPRFSWRYPERSAAQQSVYQIQVASTLAALEVGKADMWDSGNVASSSTVDIGYSGRELVPGSRYYWRVRMADGGWSKPHWWEQAPAARDWSARWIAHQDFVAESDEAAGASWLWGDDTSDTRMRRFRWQIDPGGSVVSATLLITGKDFLSVWHDGRRIAGGARPPAFERPRLAWGTMSEIPIELHSGSNTLAFEVGVDRTGYLPVPVGGLVGILRIVRPNGTVERRVIDASSKTTAVADQDTDEAWTAPNFNDDNWELSRPVARLGDPPFGLPWPPRPAVLLRREFIIDGSVASARLRATALGTIDLRLNGQPVSNDRLVPDFEDHRIRASYRSYDVTAHLRRGTNALGAILGDGWYASGLGWDLRRHGFGAPPPRALIQLDIRYTDGRTARVVSDSRWRSFESAIISSEIYAGESYDARRQQPGWDLPAFHDVLWPQVALPATAVTVGPSQVAPIRTRAIRPPAAMRRLADGGRVYDFGRNMAGVARIVMKAPRGTVITMRYAERLFPDGRVDQRNLRMATARDSYIARGGGIETFEPRFTYHGFRYVQVDGLEAPPHSIHAVAFGSDLATTGTLVTGSAMVNALIANTENSLRSNLMGVPTDCPQRDERLGWLGDAQLFWGTATYMVDAANFTRKFMRDIRDAQSSEGAFSNVAPRIVDERDGAPGWGDGGVVLPWTSWRRYGDLRIVEDNWTAMERWMEYIAISNPDGLRRNRRNADYGDWMAPRSTDKVLLATAYWARDAAMMRDMAQALGYHERGAHYSALFARLSKTFRAEFVQTDGQVGDGTQTAQAMAIAFNLVEGASRERVAARLAADARANGITTGFLGTPLLLPALASTGNKKLAYDLLLSRRNPSWGYMVDQGATSIWERWDGGNSIDSMNSLNHYALGAVVEWLYRDAAGIREIEPGFARFEVAPQFDERLGHLAATFDTAHGQIRSAWRIRGNIVSVTVSVPANTVALVRLPNGAVHSVGPGKHSYSEKLIGA